MIKYEFHRLFCEDNFHVSLGRILLWICFFYSTYFWIIREPKDFPTTLAEFSMYLLLYNISKKGISSFNTFVEKKYTTENKSVEKGK